MSDEPFAEWLGHVDAGRIGPHLGIAAAAPPTVQGDEPPAAPNVRTFSMNSAEGFEALRTPRERPWIPRGSLPPEPRCWERAVIPGVIWTALRAFRYRQVPRCCRAEG